MDIALSQISVNVGRDERLLFKIPNLKVISGEKVLVKGASGRGKTTFLHLLAGLFLPVEGTVQVGNFNLTRMNEDERALFRKEHVGMVFQKLNLIDHLTVLENVQLSQNQKTTRSRTAKALADVGLQGRENDLTSVLSLGEQQRVAIARVLASEHSLVFADEPTSSLDEKNAFDVTELLVQACAGKSLIVVSHDHRIEKYFSRILEFGEVIR